LKGALVGTWPTFCQLLRGQIRKNSSKQKTKETERGPTEEQQAPPGRKIRRTGGREGRDHWGGKNSQTKEKISRTKPFPTGQTSASHAVSGPQREVKTKDRPRNSFNLMDRPPRRNKIRNAQKNYRRETIQQKLTFRKWVSVFPSCKRLFAPNCQIER